MGKVQAGQNPKALTPPAPLPSRSKAGFVQVSTVLWGQSLSFRGGPVDVSGTSHFHFDNGSVAPRGHLLKLLIIDIKRRKANT